MTLIVVAIVTLLFNIENSSWLPSPAANIMVGIYLFLVIFCSNFAPSRI